MMKKKWLIPAVLASLIVLVVAFKLGIAHFGGGWGASGAHAERDVYWAELGQLNYVTGEIPESLKALSGKVIRIPGFVVPLTDNIKRIQEFLLVPNGMACIHAPPPPPNQMVLVKLDSIMDYELAFGPVWVKGTLSMDSYDSPFGKVGYQMTGLSVEPYQIQKRN